MSKRVMAERVGTWLRQRAGYGSAVLLGSVCWTALRFEYTPQFAPSSYERIYDFTAAVPFGKRVLIPLLAHVATSCGISQLYAFEMMEIAAAILLLLGLERIFRLCCDVPAARLLSMGMLGVLPWLFLVPRDWMLLFPWDVPAMAFMAWGILTALKGRFPAMCGLMVLASLNRESAILLPGVWLAVWMGRKPWLRLLAGVAFLCALHVVVQAAIHPSLADNAAYYELNGEMSLKCGEIWRLLNNWHWLTDYGQRVFVWLGTMAGLPVAFGLGGVEFPSALRRLGLVAWGYFWMLMVVGNIYEARIYGEITVLLYVPVALWIWRRVTGKVVYFQPGGIAEKDAVLPRGVFWLEALAAVGVVLAVVALGWGLAHGWPP